VREAKNKGIDVPSLSCSIKPSSQVLAGLRPRLGCNLAHLSPSGEERLLPIAGIASDARQDCLNSEQGRPTWIKRGLCVLASASLCFGEQCPPAAW